MNPFILTPYGDPELFCDREKETSAILSAIKNKRNLTIHSIRRMGKTGLIMNVQHRLPKKYIPIYVDIYDTTDDTSFANKLIAASIAAIEKKKNFLKKALQIFARFRASVVIEPTLGIPTVTLDLKDANESKQSIQLLWNIIKSDKRHIYQFAIDEFQQIAQYQNSKIDATIREAFQTIDNLHFIFSGSQKHMLTNLFVNTKKPLFRSTELMELKPIPYKSYSEFIAQQFRKSKKKIHKDVIHHILTWNKMHTYYVHYFCHLLYETSDKEVSIIDIERIKRRIFIEHEMLYYQIKKLLTISQWRLLSATANENVLRQPTANAIREKYSLGASSTVNRTLNYLLDNELIYEEYSPEGKVSYQVYDVFLSRWIVHKGI